MKKIAFKAFVVFSAFLFFSNNCFSQSNFKLKDLEEMIEKGNYKLGRINVDSAWINDISKYFVILRQDYSLYNKKNDVFYGYNDQDFFGTTYSLAIKCEDFTLLIDEAVHPWNYDSKYEEFKNRKLEPQITKTQVLLLNDSVSYKYIELDSVLEDQKVIKENQLYAGRKLTSTQDGMMLNTKSGDLEKGDIKLNYACVVQNGEMLGNLIITPPADCKDILGCLYFTNSGKKDNPYCLSGIATLQKKQWVLSFPFKDFKLEAAKEQQKKPKEKGRLTEIKKPSKKE